MTSSKSTKRALVSSALVILMCVAMLIGTTFAWFTDTASTAVNKIQAGNLKVDIIGENSEAHVDMLNFTKAAGAEEGEQLFWEPGCRYLTEGFRIANKGNLALKWKAQVNKGTTAANEGNFDLLDVIDFYLVTSKDVDDMGTALDEFSGKLNTTYSAPGNPTVQTTVDLKDTWLDAEIGGSWGLRPSTYLYGTFTKNFGATIDNTWRIDAGVRHNF